MWLLDMPLRQATIVREDSAGIVMDFLLSMRLIKCSILKQNKIFIRFLSLFLLILCDYRWE